jgi:TATA-box binding protein (TBP) (component of TFIID and TFIIIB)
MTSKIVYPEFDDIVVSTKTFIVMTNLVLNLKKLFDFLPITPYTAVQKKRGRKKKLFSTNDITTTVDDGAIVTLKYENQLKGIDLKAKKSLKKKKSKWFRNSFTVVIIIDNKPINFKICQNGMFQITGAKFDKHAEGCIEHIWNLIKEHEHDIFTFSRGSVLEAIFIPAMRNIDFSLGFLIDREKLAKYMSTQTEFHSLLETSFGYTGVNIKIPITGNIQNMDLKQIQYYPKNQIVSSLTYGDYMKRLSEKEQEKKLNKDRYTTFLVFHSGKVIVSSITAEFTKPAYDYFLKIISTCKDQIEEKLDV